MAGKLDIGLLMGPPPAAAAGPSEDFKDLATHVLDGNAPMRARIDALHELIHTCIAEAKAGGDEDEGPPSERSEGGY